ncbi:hypothetical protein GAN98_06545 [Bacteroides thetaiotaomicron]|uniref:DNA-directed RNA polymerase n=2 Tax=Bacteroides TaxID=816 RepID=A0A6I0SBC9_BACT4|nr:hypothetical protein GAN98_06545 [Bacteroides thetaiotaomicron]KAB4465312.1 hypothetical protein GAN67_09435 [Bacteroides thetaiotaomicron]KAB4475002.1 hypothetical protein GAN76_08405 [Bacteroides thetaiotaomicron]KAB4478032.1 hypothetical protein GAN59_03725 [Bacteroides thetaiotaomicron]KAB4487489.1 hypothetical protein GAN57_06565 [Bacteroides thetaiotaomicron]
MYMKYEIDYIPNIEWLRYKREFKKYYASLEPKRTIASALGLKLKYSGYFAMIPNAFDIEEHLAQYPVTNYMFVVDNTGHIRSVARNGSLSSSLLFDPDRLIYIIGLISSIPARNKDSITEDGYVSINSTLIRNTFKDYFSYLDYLIRTGVLCTDGQYIQGEKSKGYKFTERYENTPLVRYDYPAFQDKVEAIPQEVYSEEDKNFIANIMYEGCPYLSHWYLTQKLHIDQLTATSYAYGLMQDKLTQGRQSWDINKDKSHGDVIIRKHPLTQYHAALYNINSIAIGDYKVLIDTHVHRLHSSITNMQKDYRNFLTYDGQELVSIDIKNSQPYLACVLLNSMFWHISNDLSLSLYSLPEDIQKSITTVALPLELNKFFSKCSDGEFTPYKQTVADGRMYETIAQVCQTSLHKSINRNEAKTLMFHLLFSSNQGQHDDTTINQMKDIFSTELFPKVALLFKIIKRKYKGVPIKKQHNRLACLLQSIESEIILHRCCKRIWEEGNNQVPVFTIHDSIATTVEHVEWVKMIIEEELTRVIGLPPTLSIEHWNANNNSSSQHNSNIIEE